MDRSWINVVRSSDEYENGVNEFIEFARKHDPNINEKFYCPCIKCLNDRRLSVREIREHIICDGFNKNYTRWIWHGEIDIPDVSRVEDSVNEDDDEVMYDNIEEMINDVGAEAFEQAHENKSYDALSADADKPLYPGCKTYSRLSAILKLIQLKATHGLSDKCFTELLILFKGMLPEDNELPESNYKAKKILCPLGLGYKKIHACPNDCILYRKDFKNLHECPKCGISRYKNSNDESGIKKPPSKVLWYLPIIPRFKRLFASPTEAKNLRWHADEKIDDGKLRHPSDSPQWKKMDQLYPFFGNEPRNLRAFNAYHIMKGTHARQLKKLKWVYPKCHGQGEAEEYGLFVMRHMLEIIKLDIVDSFEKRFNMDGPYSKADIDVVRRDWAECFLENSAIDAFYDLPSPDKIC
ncbi:hypothetical protein CASFOL_039519 [Castilleja foliolosa]|uniref:Transposase-associated domain-containing protein n=1 Tax=Castilleja foliolosa TaxID=1961234 RepID=A0ABD3BK74_9LAMI